MLRDLGDHKLARVQARDGDRSTVIHASPACLHGLISVKTALAGYFLSSMTYSHWGSPVHILFVYLIVYLGFRLSTKLWQKAWQ